MDHCLIPFLLAHCLNAFSLTVHQFLSIMELGDHLPTELMDDMLHLHWSETPNFMLRLCIKWLHHVGHALAAFGWGTYVNSYSEILNWLERPTIYSDWYVDDCHPLVALLDDSLLECPPPATEFTSQEISVLSWPHLFLTSRLENASWCILKKKFMWSPLHPVWTSIRKKELSEGEWWRGRGSLTSFERKQSTLVWSEHRNRQVNCGTKILSE